MRDDYSKEFAAYRSKPQKKPLVLAVQRALYQQQVELRAKSDEGRRRYLDGTLSKISALYRRTQPR